MREQPYERAWLADLKWNDTHWRFTTREDVAAIVALCRGVAGNIVEIGANTGVTSRNLAANLPDRVIYAVEYAGKNRTMCHDQMGENPERDIFADCEGIANVVCIHGRGAEVPYAALRDVGGGAGAVFIDGDHTYEGVKADTRRAWDHGVRLLLWHDIIGDTHVSESLAALYGKKVGDPHWNGVSRYLREFEAETGREVTRIAGTNLGYLVR